MADKELLHQEKKLVAEEKDLVKSLNSRIGKLALAMERARIDEYTSMLIKPWKFFMVNFVAGIFRGLGMAIGFTLIFALIIYILTVALKRMVDMPIIGMYIAELVKFVNQYLQQGIPVQ